MKKNIIIIVLSIVALSLIGYIIYNNSKYDNCVNEFYIDVKKENVNYSLFDDIITNELSGLEKFTSLSEVTNEYKMIMLYNLYKKNNNNLESFTKNNLEIVKQNSSLANIDIVYDNISDIYGLYSVNEGVVGYTYDKTSEVYTYSSNLSHGALSEGIIYKKLIDYRKENNKYILDYVYVFYNGGNMSSKENVSIYLTINDLLNNKSYKDFSNEIDLPIYKNKDDAIKYIEENYDVIKAELKSYSYEFEIINDKVILSNYYVK